MLVHLLLVLELLAVNAVVPLVLGLVDVTLVPHPLQHLCHQGGVLPLGGAYEVVISDVQLQRQRELGEGGRDEDMIDKSLRG